MTTQAEVRVIRSSVALSEAEHVACVRVCGPDAHEVMDALCPADLHLMDGQIRHTLLLREDGRPLVDLFLCNDDGTLLLLAEGLSAGELKTYVESTAPGGTHIDVIDLTETHRLFSLNGPYAWELLVQLEGPEAVGMPFMTFFNSDQWTCFRAGKTGEYGYDFLVPRPHAETFRARVLEDGAALDLGLAGLEALDHCALENFYFNIRREGQAKLTPLELQLQWRVSYRKEYVGASALRARRATGPTGRLTSLVGPGPAQPGDGVTLEDRRAGVILNAAFSALRGDYVALALIDLPYAYPGIDGFEWLREGTASPARSVSPPVINNRSLYVNPQRHSYATRHADRFPPLA